MTIVPVSGALRRVIIIVNDAAGAGFNILGMMIPKLTDNGKMQKTQLHDSFRTCEIERGAADRAGLSGILSYKLIGLAFGSALFSFSRRRREGLSLGGCVPYLVSQA